MATKSNNMTIWILVIVLLVAAVVVYFAFAAPGGGGVTGTATPIATATGSMLETATP